MRFRLTAAEGVAEVAAIGGFEREYQIVVDPRKSQAFGIPLERVTEAVRANNRDIGGRTIEMRETEYMAYRAADAGRAARPRNYCSRQGSRTVAVFQPAGDHRLVFACLCA